VSEDASGEGWVGPQARVGAAAACDGQHLAQALIGVGGGVGKLLEFDASWLDDDGG
jgi:hypothetical protein